MMDVCCYGDVYGSCCHGEHSVLLVDTVFVCVFRHVVTWTAWREAQPVCLIHVTLVSRSEQVQISIAVNTADVCSSQATG